MPQLKLLRKIDGLTKVKKAMQKKSVSKSKKKWYYKNSLKNELKLLSQVDKKSFKK